MTEYKFPKFFITKVVCPCGNEIGFEPDWYEEYEWLLICCDKCGHNVEYNMESVYFNKKEM